MAAAAAAAAAAAVAVVVVVVVSTLEKCGECFVDQTLKGLPLWGARTNHYEANKTTWHNNMPTLDNNGRECNINPS